MFPTIFYSFRESGLYEGLNRIYEIVEWIFVCLSDHQSGGTQKNFTGLQKFAEDGLHSITTLCIKMHEKTIKYVALHEK